MRKLLFIAFVAIHVSAFGASKPYICFTDLTSGPSSGNSDNSQPAQVAGQDGVIVTLWGKNLGATQGGSRVFVGNQIARIYSWGNATAPAELYNNLGLQMVEFQIPATLSNGSTDIKVVVNGMTSNVLPFTIRSGNIYFLKTTGDDNTGDGSWTNPWATLDNQTNTGALEKIGVGDIVYVCNGVNHTALAGDRATIDLGNPGTETAPKAIIGYPGAIASIGNTAIEKCYALFVSGLGRTSNWVISKLHLTAASDVAAMFNNFRVVGNRITAPTGDGPTGAVPGLGNHLYLLGNELTNIGFAGTSKLYHPIYFQSEEACSGPRLPTETDREIAWNNMHDNLSYDGINIFRECGSSAYMTDHRVHDNFILNQTGCGIRIGDYVTGENWIYNNVVVNAGLGPNPGGDEAMHVPVYIHPGWEGTTTTIHFYNNTVYGGSFTGGAAWASGMVAFAYTHPFTLDFRNNIIVATVPGVAYLNPQLSGPASGAENNIWFGAGAAPSWDVNPMAMNPLFVNPAANNFRLQIASQARDAARPLTATAAQPLPAYDFDANNRPQNNITDLGAFEFEITAPLPVTWLDVQVKRVDQSQAMVIWRVSDQQNVKDYIVQYSTDGIVYSDGCIIAAASQPSYSCLVPAIGNSSYHYRVHQRDYDGRGSYSKTILLQATKPSLFWNLLPNPAHDYTILSYPITAGKNIVVTIYDGQGASVFRQNFLSDNSGTIRIPLSGLLAGWYSLRAQSGSESRVIKLVKQ
jgi:hypothetical protein